MTQRSQWDLISIGLRLPAGVKTSTASSNSTSSKDARLSTSTARWASSTSSWGWAWLEVEVSGRVDHAGACAMPDRRDALQAAARMIVETENVTAGKERRPWRRSARCKPSRGRRTSCQGRHTSQSTYAIPTPRSCNNLVRGLQRRFADIAAQRDLTVTATIVKENAPHHLSDDLRKVLQTAAESLGFSALDLPSGAGHDSQTMGTAIPAAMIFVPSVGGRSHSPAEYSTPEDCANGASVLATALRDLAW